MSVAAYDSGAALAAYRNRIRDLVVARGLPGDADDIAQETVARFLARAPELDLRVDPYPWMARVAMNLCCDVRRVRSRVISSGYGTDVPVGVTASPLDALMRAEQRDAVASALAQLPPRDRELLTLRFVESVSFEVLAGRYGMTVNAMRQRVFRARSRLRVVVMERIDRIRAAILLVAIRWRSRRFDAGASAPSSVFATTFAAQFALPLAVVAGLAGGIGHRPDSTRPTGDAVSTTVSVGEAKPAPPVAPAGRVRAERPAARPAPPGASSGIELDAGDGPAGVTLDVEQDPEGGPPESDLVVEVGDYEIRVQSYYEPGNEPPPCTVAGCLP